MTPLAALNLIYQKAKPVEGTDEFGFRIHGWLVSDEVFEAFEKAMPDEDLTEEKQTMNTEPETKEYQDISMTIGPLEGYGTGPAEVQCLSFNRVAKLFLYGVYHEAIDNGFSHQKALNLLTHTWIRHGLDGFEEELEALGREFFRRNGLQNAPNCD